jgi:hypothetical protein
MESRPANIDLEFEEILKLVLAGKKDDELVKRARERGDELRKEMRAKYGHRNIAVKLIREARNEA